MGVVSSTGYLGIVVLMFAENVFPPIPSEFIMPLAGYMANRGALQLGAVVAAGTAGAVLGALPLYYLGRRWSEDRAKRFADRHGGAATFFCRLVPGIRSLISIPAGITRMGLFSFLACTGYAIGARFASVGDYLDPVSWVVFGIIALLYCYRVVRHKAR